jgi:uncharacterized membrane protein
MTSDGKLKLASILIAMVGLADAIYLSWSKLTQKQVFCGTSSQCETVNNSPYSEIGGVPIALLGLGAYLLILFLLYLENRGGFWRENSPLILFGITLVGVLYSAYLTYIEVAVLRAICPYCVVSAVAMTALFGVTLIRLVRAQTVIESIRNTGG